MQSSFDQTKLDELLAEIRRLREIVTAMQARNERIPFEAEEQLHTIEEMVQEMMQTPTKQ